MIDRPTGGPGHPNDNPVSGEAGARPGHRPLRGRVLVVDDEPSTRDLLMYMLRFAGYDVQTAANGLEGVKRLFAERPDLVITDVMMPDMDGWTFLARIREASTVPVLMLTALGNEDARVRGLRGGADDYLSKPFSQAELLARVEALLRRARPAAAPSEEVYDDGVVHMDFLRHRVAVRGREVELSVIEFRLLAALVRNRNIVLDAERLLDMVWNSTEIGIENVRVYIGYLRQKLEEDSRSPRLVQTVRGFGYRYSPPDDANR